MERVQLADLALSDFRNISAARIHPGSRFNVFGGRNGMGKTNLVEAVYLLGALRSFRTSSRMEMVRHGRESASVEGVFAGATGGVRCQIAIAQNERRVRVDGKAQRPEGEHFRMLPMVLFHPGNLDLAQGGPPSRRRFLDRALFQISSPYPTLLRDYGRALRSRNRLLKDRPVDSRAIEPFDRQLASLGDRICRLRAEFVAFLAPLFEKTFAAVSGASRAAVIYRPSIEGDADEIASALVGALKSDAERGYTAIGPHADDLDLAVDGQPARRFASQGQQRAVVLSLKIAETLALTNRTTRIPLLLLDDVSSELDEQRNARLFDFLVGVGGQVFITTTNFETIRVEEQRTDFEVVEGEFRRRGGD